MHVVYVSQNCQINSSHSKKSLFSDILNLQYPEKSEGPRNKLSSDFER